MMVMNNVVHLYKRLISVARMHFVVLHKRTKSNTSFTAMSIVIISVTTTVQVINDILVFLIKVQVTIRVTMSSMAVSGNNSAVQ